MSLLSSPSTVRSESDTFYEKILLTLSSIRTPEAVKWLHYYVDFTNAQLVKPFVRDAFVVALVERDFPRLWEWIRNWDFDTDLKYPHLVQGIDPEDEAENLEEMSQERERLLIVLLDLVFKRAYMAANFQVMHKTPYSHKSLQLKHQDSHWRIWRLRPLTSSKSKFLLRISWTPLRTCPLLLSTFSMIF
jgi:hypothetical protein